MNNKISSYCRACHPLKTLAAAVIACLPPLAAAQTLSLPSGGNVVAGTASISRGEAALTIQQSSPRAVINWDTFNVGSQAQVNFLQPTASSAILNRVLDSAPSQIFGRISANGQVFLINPAGVLFSPSASVDAGALVVSSHAINDTDFMAGNYVFSRGDSQGKVVNQGSLTARESELGGFIALLAPEVRNEGVIVARMGTIALAAGEVLSLRFDAGGRFNSVAVTPSQLSALVENRSLVLAPGGQVILSAQAANALLGGVVTNSGRIEATGLAMQNGKLVLAASDTLAVTGALVANNDHGAGGSISLLSGGDIRLSGARIDVSGLSGGGRIAIQGGSAAVGAETTAATAPTVMLTGATRLHADSVQGVGGEITVTGQHVGLTDQSFLSAVGQGGGGLLQVGGSWQNSNASVTQAAAIYVGKDVVLDASAGLHGDGGTIVAWSDVNNAASSTRVYGSMRARGGTLDGDGGRIETSGHWLDVAGVAIDASAAAGNRGQWLLDPSDLTVTAAATDTPPAPPGLFISDDTFGTNVLNSDIEAILDTGTDVVLQTGAAGAQNGDITLSANIAKSGGLDATLTLAAVRNITLDTGVTISSTSNALNVVLQAGAGGIGDISLASGAGIAGNGTIQLLTAGALTLAPTSTLSGTSLLIGTPPGGTIGISGAVGTLQLPASYFSTNFVNGFANIVIGDPFAGLVTVGGATTVSDNLSLYSGTGIQIDAGLNVGGNTLELNGPTANSASGTITAGSLLLSGNGANYSLASGSGHNVGTLAAGDATALITVGNVSFLNSGALTIGTVPDPSGLPLSFNGINAAGTVAIATTSGNLTVSQNINTADTTASALVLNAGQTASAGTATGGNLIIAGGSITVGAGGTGRLYSGSIAGSTGLTSLLGSGSGRFRYNSDETASNFTTALASGQNAIYREQPVLSAAPGASSMTYGGATPAFTVGFSGFANGDTSAAPTGTATWTVGGSQSGSGNYVVGNHDVSYTGGLVSGLGYALINNASSLNELTVTALALTGSIASSSGTYGSVLTPGAASFSNAVAGDTLGTATVTITTAGNTSSSGNLKAGTYTGIQSVTALSGADAGNYSFTGVLGNVSVASLALTGAIATSSGTYGSVLTPGAASFSNAIVGDNLGTATVTINTAGNTSSSGNLKAGTYTGIQSITALSGADAGNYSFTGVLGNVSVASLALTGAIATSSGTYGSVLTPGAASFSNGIVGDSLGTATVTINTAGNTSSSGNLNAGAYTGIQSITALSGPDAGNYSFTGVLGNVSVNQLALTGSIATSSGTYGSVLTPGAASFANAVAGDNLGTATVTLNTAGNTSSSGNLKAGTYTGIQSVTALSGADAGNYNFTGVLGNVSVSALALTGSISASGSTYGAPLVPGVATFTNVVGADNLGTATISINTTGNTGTFGWLNVGNYVGIQGVSALSGPDGGNYSLAGVTGDYSVTGTSATARSRIPGESLWESIRIQVRSTTTLGYTLRPFFDDWGASLTPAMIVVMSPDRVRLLTPETIARLGAATLQAMTPDQLAVLSQAQVNSLSVDQVQELSFSQFQAMVPASFARITEAQIARLSPAGRQALFRLATVARDHAGDTVMSVREALASAPHLADFMRELEQSVQFNERADNLFWSPGLAEARYGRWPVFPAMQGGLVKVAAADDGSDPLVALATDIGAYFAQKKSDGLFSSAADRVTTKLAAKGKPAKVLLEAAPVVGNLLSLYTAVTGKDALSGEAVGGAERALAVLGTIPGGGTLLKVAGRSSILVMERLLLSSATKKLGSAKEVSEAALELLAVFQSENAKAALDQNGDLGELAAKLLKPYLPGK